MAVARILKRHGYVVSEAATVDEALRKLMDGSIAPNWILLDLMLPDGCGINVIHNVRSRRIASRVCVITGCGEELVAEARSAGAEHALSKPLDVSRLISILSEEIDDCPSAGTRSTGYATRTSQPPGV